MLWGLNNFVLIETEYCFFHTNIYSAVITKKGKAEVAEIDTIYELTIAGIIVIFEYIVSAMFDFFGIGRMWDAQCTTHLFTDLEIVGTGGKNINRFPQEVIVCLPHAVCSEHVWFILNSSHTNFMPQQKELPPHSIFVFCCVSKTTSIKSKKLENNAQLPPLSPIT